MTEEQFDLIDNKLKFLASAYVTLHNELIKRRLPEEDFIIRQISILLAEIKRTTNLFMADTKIRETFRMPDEFVELIGTMRFIAKRMDAIEKRFQELDGLEFKHKIQIEVKTDEVEEYNAGKLAKVNKSNKKYSKLRKIKKKK